jgi:type IV pilus assembly protein PilY1
MLRRAHDGVFTSTREYAGYFDPKTYYSYSDMEDGPRFTPDDASGSWNGNFLNWAFMTRKDIMRKGLTGGAYDRQTQCLVATGTRMFDPEQIVEYDDSSPVMDLTGRTKFMTPHRQSLSLGPAPEKGAVRVHLKVEDHVHVLRVQGKRKTGALHSLRKSARIALFVSGGPDRGGLLHPMGDAESNLEAIAESVDSLEADDEASLAQALCTVLGDIRQNCPGDTVTPSSQSQRDEGLSSPGGADPFHFPDLGKNLPCSRQNVVIITDATRSGDTDPTENVADQRPCLGLQPDNSPETYGATELSSIALMGHTSDLRPEEGMDGQQSWTLFTVSVGRLHNPLLMDAARCGNFDDQNGNGLPDLRQEYDTDENGLPDGYFEAGSDLDLRDAMTRALQRATAVPTSGNDAHACAMSGQGAGAGQILYQAVFFPPSPVSRSAPPWSGQIHAYFVDDAGNLREDTDGNGRLDPSCDRIVEFDGERILRHGNVGTGNATQSQQETEELDSILDIRFPWTTSTWLNSLSDDEATCQRYAYASPTRQRHIFTFVDKDRDMVPDAGEVQPFALPDLPRSLNDADEFHNYLTLFESGPGRIGLDQSRPEQQALGMLRTSDPGAFDKVLATLAKRQVDFIRGADVGNATVCGVADHARSRVRGGVPWRLGDIVHSGPAVVGRPAENYHLVYGDRTYEAFARKYADRRQVVYSGANDGMLHAFNAGFAAGQRAAFDASSDDRVLFPLGMELWAYVPYNLLPHLRWLMRPDYGEKLHVPYMDLEPRVFDVRIFFGPDGMTPQDDAHPDGWGTILVAGRRLGGALIEPDIDTPDGNAFTRTSTAP